MTVYAIYSKPEDGPEAVTPVGDRFIFSAALLPPVWALTKGAWRLLILWVLAVVVLMYATPYLGNDVAVSLYILFALWCGFAAPVFAMRALARRGWIANGELVAKNQDAALSRWLMVIYGARP